MKSYISLSSYALSLMFLAGCATTPVAEVPTTPAARLAAAMIGTYDRAASDEAEPLRDRRLRLSPLGAGEWLYYQVNEGADLEEVYRQRVLHLQTREDGSVAQLAYTLNTPEPYQALEAPLGSLTLADLDRTLTEGCEMVWIEMANGWAGRVDPARCVIFSERRQSELRIGSRADLMGNRLRQAESGYDMDGNPLWGSKDGEWLTLYRDPNEG